MEFWAPSAVQLLPVLSTISAPSPRIAETSATITKTMVWHMAMGVVILARPVDTAQEARMLEAPLAAQVHCILMMRAGTEGIIIITTTDMEARAEAIPGIEAAPDIAIAAEA